LLLNIFYNNPAKMSNQAAAIMVKKQRKAEFSCLFRTGTVLGNASFHFLFCNTGKKDAKKQTHGICAMRL